MTMPATLQTFETRATLFMVLLTACALPFRISGVATEQTLLGLALLAALVLLYLRKDVRENLKASIMSKTGKLLLMLFALWAITALFSHNPVKSFEIGGRTGMFILAAAIVGSVLCVNPQHHVLMWKVFVGSAVGFGGAALLSLMGLPEILTTLNATFDYELLYGDDPIRPQYHLKAYATATVCMMPVAVYGGRVLGQKWRYLGYAYVFLACAIVLMTETRSALAGILGALIVGSIVFAVKRGYVLRALAFALVVGAGALAWIRDVRSVYLTEFTENTYLPGWLIDPHRQQIWKFAYERFMDHPIVGNGIDQLNRLPGADDIIPELGSTAYVVPSHPHSWVLEILSETGLLGFVPMIFVIGYLAYTRAKSFLRTGDEGALAQLLLLTAFFTCSLFSFSIWAVWWQLVLYILFAMVYATRQTRYGRA